MLRRLAVALSTAYILVGGVCVVTEQGTTFKPSPGYKTFNLTTANNVTRVLISNPPINLLDGNMLNDFNKLLTTLQDKPDESSKVVILSSADPHFWISHLDLHSLAVASPPQPPFTAAGEIQTYVNITNLLASVPAIIIAEISGEGSAGANEITVQMDMRFASTGASLGALETSVGVLHAAGGLQHLVRLIGPGRAAEYLFSAENADAKRMAEIGWVNRAFDDRKAMEQYVDKLAARIALFPRGGLVATKKGIRDGFGPRPGTVANDLRRFNELNALPVTQALEEKFLRLGKNQTRSPFELGISDTLVELYQ